MIQRAPFGRTGHQSSRVIFGAAALAAMSQERSDRVLAEVTSAGINHIDTAASYGDSELRLAPWLADHRDEVFLASKTDRRDASGARAQLELSLDRLGVERLDLIQFHNLVEREDWETVHRPGGALEAMIAARDEGLVGHIGVTGHGTRIPRMHIRSLGEFDYDSVLFPYNFAMMANPEYRADVEELIGLCSLRNVATQTIKAVARRRWPDPPARRFSWYEPLTDPAAIGRAVDYVLGRPGLFLNTTSDARLLPLILEAAGSGRGVPSEEVMRADVEAQHIEPLFDGGRLERI